MERRSDEMNEICQPGQSERYAVRDDADAIAAKALELAVNL